MNWWKPYNLCFFFFDSNWSKKFYLQRRLTTTIFWRSGVMRNEIMFITSRNLSPSWRKPTQRHHIFLSLKCDILAHIDSRNRCKSILLFHLGSDRNAKIYSPDAFPHPPEYPYFFSVNNETYEFGVAYIFFTVSRCSFPITKVRGRYVEFNLQPRGERQFAANHQASSSSFLAEKFRHQPETKWDWWWRIRFSSPLAPDEVLARE